MFKGHLLTTWRLLGRNKLNTLINVLGLSLGMGACIVIYLITGFELSFDTFHKDKERIYRLGAKVQENTGTSSVYEAYAEDVPPPVPSALRQEIPGLESVAGFYSYPASVTVQGSDNTKSKQAGTQKFILRNAAIITGPEYFSIFQYDWLAGGYSPDKAKRVLGESFDRVVLGDRGLNYERLDQLTNEVLLGVR